MNEKEKYGLITRNLQEVINPGELKKLLNSKKNPVIYWGTMPTGSPHFGYFLPLLKVGDFLKAGLEVKILISDLHAALDGIPWEILEKRQKYYEVLFPKILEALNIPTKKLKFIRGSKFQLSKEYFHDLLKLSMHASARDAKRAASEVVKLSENPKLGNFLYPIMQALDEVYLNADIQFGGTDQRKIFVFAREFLPKIGQKPRVELMNKMMPGLSSEKMSSSIPSSKIDILDDKKTVKNKIKKANFPPGSTESGLMKWLKYIIFPILKDKKQNLKIERPEKFGGSIEIKNYVALEALIKSEKLHPQDIKNAVAKEINEILKKIQKPILFKLYKEAYEN